MSTGDQDDSTPKILLHRIILELGFLKGYAVASHSHAQTRYARLEHVVHQIHANTERIEAFCSRLPTQACASSMDTTTRKARRSLLETLADLKEHLASFEPALKALQFVKTWGPKILFGLSAWIQWGWPILQRLLGSG